MLGTFQHHARESLQAQRIWAFRARLEVGIKKHWRIRIAIGGCYSVLLKPIAEPIFHGIGHREAPAQMQSCWVHPSLHRHGKGLETCGLHFCCRGIHIGFCPRMIPAHLVGAVVFHDVSGVSRSLGFG